MDGPTLYIAGMGVITPLGGTTATTAAAVTAGISAYTCSEYELQDDEPITMANVPDIIFDELEAEIDEGDCFDFRHDRVIKMAIIALCEACAGRQTTKAVPLIMAMPEFQFDNEGLAPLIPALAHNLEPWIATNLTRSIFTGRAAGIEAIEFIFRYLYDSEHDYFLVGGSDSYKDDELLHALDKEGRLLKATSQDSFAPGEGAGFLLLTRHPELAQVREGKIIALSAPGVADETGHLGSEEPYKGEGLDQAFKKALINRAKDPHAQIHSIYSSMNGENHWAKEYGVAFLRNRTAFKENVQVQHPADCYGDLGTATAPVLIALAAEHLFKHPQIHAHLVYSSSDGAKRGAIVVEKQDMPAQLKENRYA